MRFATGPGPYGSHSKGYPALLDPPHAQPPGCRYAVLKWGDPRHGTIGGYTNHRCRCRDCKAAIGRYNRTKRRGVAA